MSVVANGNEWRGQRLIITANNDETRMMARNLSAESLIGGGGMDDKFYKLPCRLAQCRELNGNDKIILAILADRIGQHETCWPGQRTLAKDAGFRSDTAGACTSRLEKTRYIEIEKRGNGRRQYYRLTEKGVRIFRAPGNSKRSENQDTTVRKIHTEAPGNSVHNQTDQITRPNKGVKVSFPAKLTSIDGFEAAWGEWLTYRRERKLTVTPTCLKKQLAMLENQPDPIAVLNQSIQNGWQGLFPIKGDSNHGTPEGEVDWSAEYHRVNGPSRNLSDEEYQRLLAEDAR
jgi:DNA-binding MarR family transcriptional regulator